MCTTKLIDIEKGMTQCTYESTSNKYINTHTQLESDHNVKT